MRAARALAIAALLSILLMSLPLLRPSPPAIAQPNIALNTAFSVRSDVDDNLYRIDLNTGAATLIGPVGFGDVEALTFCPDGVLFGVDDVTNSLITVNPSTGAGTLVGALGVAITDMGLTCDADGELFMSVDAPQNFFRVNRNTGAATLIGAQGQEVTGLTTVGSTNTILGLGGDGTNNLVRMNTTTGAATVIGALGGGINVDDGGLDFDTAGQLWGINDQTRIFAINSTTGAGSLGAITLGGFESLAIYKGTFPIAANDTFQVPAGTPTTIAAPGVLANDTDPEGQQLFARLTTNPSNGTLTLNPNGSFTYTPNAGFTGTDTFLYRINDGFWNSREAVVSIRVLAGISISDASLTEGNSGTTNMLFDVRLAPAGVDDVSVFFSTADGTAGAPADYQSTTGLVTFRPGETLKQVAIPVVGDLLVEGNENFFVNLSNATGTAQILDNQAIGTIIDNDITGFFISDVSLQEGNAGQTNAVFNITLNNPSLANDRVSFRTLEGTGVSGSTCGPGVDFINTGGNLTFNARTTVQQVSVPVCGDTDPEANETFFVNLFNSASAPIQDAQGNGTIINDDGAAPTGEGDPDERKLTEEQRQQRKRTNTASLEDYHTEGNVVAVECDARPPRVQIVNVDGPMWVELWFGTDRQCPRIRVGDYLIADGEKDNEQRFVAEEVNVERRGR